MSPLDRRTQSQSVRVEPRDDAEVEGRRQKLLKACNGFRDHDDHLKGFFNTTSNPKTQSECSAARVCMSFFAEKTEFEKGARVMVVSLAFDKKNLTRGRLTAWRVGRDWYCLFDARDSLFR